MRWEIPSVVLGIYRMFPVSLAAISEGKPSHPELMIVLNTGGQSFTMVPGGK